MKLTNVGFFLIVICFLFTQGNGQTEKIKITKFIVDGQEIECKYKLTITIDGRHFKPSFEDKTFVVPEQVRKGKNIAIELNCNEYSIVMKPVGKRHFYTPDNSRYEWYAGIDSAPFEEADVPEEIVDKVSKVHYIRFLPYYYVATRLQVFFPKEEKKKKPCHN